MGVTENAAYLKGLAEGMNISDSSNEGKLILKRLAVISEMAEKINVLEILNEDLYDYMEEMAKDLVSLEDDFYLEDEEEEYENYSDLNDDEEFSMDDALEYYEVECPTCSEKICFTDEIDIENLRCPACGEPVGEIELSCGECDNCRGCE